MTSLITLFDTFESEEDAILAFYRRQAMPARTPQSGITVLCVDQSADVLAYLRELWPAPATTCLRITISGTR